MSLFTLVSHDGRREGVYKKSLVLLSSKITSGQCTRSGVLFLPIEKQSDRLILVFIVGYMGGRIEGWINRSINGWMDEWMDGWTD